MRDHLLRQRSWRHNIELEAKRHEALAEIARVLKPGATAMIADFPGVACYAPILHDHGLHVEGPFRAERIALGISGFLVASKPG